MMLMFMLKMLFMFKVLFMLMLSTALHTERTQNDAKHDHQELVQHDHKIDVVGAETEEGGATLPPSSARSPSALLGTVVRSCTLLDRWLGLKCAKCKS